MINKKQGINLIELAIVMAVIGLIVGGIYIASSVVYKNFKEAETQEDIVQIVQNIRATYSIANGVPSSITNDIMINAGIVPSDMVVPDSGDGTPGVANPFGGYIVIGNDSTDMHGNPIFDIQIGNIPVPVCVDLAVKASSIGTKAAIDAGLSMVSPGDNTYPNDQFPIDPAVAETYCQAHADYTDGGTSVVTYFYTIK